MPLVVIVVLPQPTFDVGLSMPIPHFELEMTPDRILWMSVPLQRANTCAYHAMANAIDSISAGSLVGRTLLPANGPSTLIHRQLRRC